VDLRVLFIESRAGAGAVHSELKRAGYVLTSQRVQTEAAMRRALLDGTWDLIIANAALPDLSAMAALTVLQELALDVPFVVVSTTLDEATSLELLRAGAHDVIDQDTSRRLIPAIERELREAEQRRQHRRSDEALRVSEERYRLLVESSPDAIAVHSQGVIVFANPAAARLMAAADPGELLGKPVMSFVHPDDRPLVVERIKRTQQENRTAEPVQERFVRLDGVVIHVETVAHPTRFEGRVATQVVVRDITADTLAQAAQARAEAELTASRNQFEAILGGIADGVIVQESDARFVYANDAAARLAGFDSASEYLTATATEISSRLEVTDALGQPFDYEQLPARRALRGEVAPEMVVQYRRRDTWERRWSLTRARLVHGADGQPLAISIFHDLTDRIRAEQRLAFLAEAGARLGMSLDERETLEAVTELAVQQIADWAVVYFPDEHNEALHRIAFAHKEHTRLDVAQELEDRYPLRPAPDSTLWRVQEHGESVLTHDLSDAVLVRVARDAEHLRLLRELQLVSAMYVPLQARGRSLGVLALFTDSNSGRRLEAEDLAVSEEIARRLALAVDNARLYRQTRDAIRARDEFLSLASHELRNPVAAISGTAQLIERARLRHQLDDRLIDRYMSVIQRTSAHLAHLTEDLLDVGRLQEGRLPLRFEEMDLAELVRGIAAREQSRAEGAHISLALECDPCQIVADADRLEQVITNLLENARKYSPQRGSIQLQLCVFDDGRLLAVRDHGIGLPAGSAERIFEPFGRARNATERNIPGLGLGLYISRQIVERHGGRLWAESRGEGHGTTFRLWLPALATQ
jgi:PAS domain S-box-containing protein